MQVKPEMCGILEAEWITYDFKKKKLIKYYSKEDGDWKLTIGFSNMQIINNINKNGFVEVMKAKAWLKWVQKRLGRN